MSCDNSAINGMNPGMAGFIVAKKRVMELNDSMQQGIVYLLGAGPGDPGLMTVRGRELVEAAEVLVYDALSSAELLNWAPAACERIFVGKRASRHALPQEEINALLVKLGRAGKKVVRLKGGDPYVFGRGGEEADALHEAGVPFEVIPGITSAIAGPAYAGIPVTHRKYCTQFTVFTGHEDVNKKESSLDLKGIAGAQGTKIMLMGMQKLADVCEALTGYGQEPSTPAAAIQWATTGIQRTVTGTVRTLPAKVQKAGLGAPAVVVIGDVVKERDSLAWFEKLPLFGKRIVVTRTRAQAGELSVRLRRLGAEVLEMPTIRMAP
ncbi:uroporphyrinogen-III C-methyltransferase, partial [Akkermansia sp.]